MHTVSSEPATGSLATHAGWLLLLLLCSLLLYAPTPFSGSPTTGVDLLASESRALVANHGRDRSGEPYPLFYHASGDVWLMPVPLYFSGLISRSFEPVDGARWAAALTAVVNVLLVYGAAFVLLRRTGLAALASVLFLTSPAHVALARTTTLDGVWALPFLLAWLIALTRLVSGSARDARGMLAVAVAALALGVYSQPSAVIVIPFLLVVTVGVVFLIGRLQWRDTWPAAAALAAVLAPAVVWLAAHPGAYADTFGRWAVHLAYVRNPIEWARAVSNWNTLTVWTEVYWDLLNPTYLFINDRAAAGVGVFVSPLFILFVVGCHAALAGQAATPSAMMMFRLLVLVFVGVPLVIATFREPRAIQLALVVVPVGVLLATLGTQSLWRWRSVLGQTTSVLAILAALIQFVIYFKQSDW